MIGDSGSIGVFDVIGIGDSDSIGVSGSVSLVIFN